MGSTGGGDSDECYELVLRQAWRDSSWAPGSQRALVMIGVAIPHEQTYHMNTLKLKWENEVKQLYNDMVIFLTPYISIQSFNLQM